MQLTRTNAVFSTVALVSSFCAEKSTFGKTPIFIGIIITHRRTHGNKRGDGVAARGDHTLAGRGQGWAHALIGCGQLEHPPTLPFGLLKVLDLIFDGGFVIFRETHPRSAANTISILGIRSSALAPCRDGDSEEIVTIVIITASPSTIDDPQV